MPCSHNTQCLSYTVPMVGYNPLSSLEVASSSIIPRDSRTPHGCHFWFPAGLPGGAKSPWQPWWCQTRSLVYLKIVYRIFMGDKLIIDTILSRKMVG